MTLDTKNYETSLTRRTKCPRYQRYLTTQSRTTFSLSWKSQCAAAQNSPDGLFTCLQYVCTPVTRWLPDMQALSDQLMANRENSEMKSCCLAGLTANISMQLCRRCTGSFACWLALRCIEKTKLFSVLQTFLFCE